MTERRHVCAQHRAQRGEFTLPGAAPSYPPDLRIEPTHLDVTLGIDVDGNELTGVTTLTVRARAAGPRTLALDAVDFLDLEVTGEEVSHVYDGDKIRVTCHKGSSLRDCDHAVPVGIW